VCARGATDQVNLNASVRRSSLFFFFFFFFFFFDGNAIGKLIRARKVVPSLRTNPLIGEYCSICLILETVQPEVNFLLFFLSVVERFVEVWVDDARRTGS
jgi:hypothetical protein